MKLVTEQLQQAAVEDDDEAVAGDSELGWQEAACFGDGDAIAGNVWVQRPVAWWAKLELDLVPPASSMVSPQ